MNRDNSPIPILNHNLALNSLASTIEICLSDVVQLLKVDLACVAFNNSSAEQFFFYSPTFSFDREKPVNTPLPDQLPSDLHDVEALAEHPQLRPLAAKGYEAALEMPLFKTDAEQPFGVLYLLNRDAIHLTPQSESLLRLLSQNLSLHIERHQLSESEQAAKLQAKALQEISTALTSNLNIESLFDILLEQINRVIPSDVSHLAMVEGEELIVMQTLGKEQYLTAPDQLPTILLDEVPLLRAAIKDSRPLLVKDTNIDDDWVWIPGSLYIRSWIGVPIHVNQRLEVFLSLHKAEPSFYDEHHLTIMESFQAHAAVAIRNARVFEQSSRQSHELRLLNQLSHDITAAVTIPEVCQVLVQCLHQSFGYHYAAVYIAAKGSDQFVLREQAGISAEPHIIGQEVFKRDEYPLHPTLKQHQHTAAGLTTLINRLILPVSVGGNHIGILCVEYPATQHDVETTNNSHLLLNTVSDHFAIAIEKARSFENTKRYTREIETLYDVSAKLRNLKTIDKILNIMVKQCTRVVQATGGSVMLLEPETGDLILRANEPPDPQTLGARYQKGRGIVHYVAETKEIYVAKDVTTDPLTYMPGDDLPRISEAKSSISLPLLTEERLVGVLNIWYNTPHRFTTDEKRVLKALAEIASNAVERASMWATLEQRVHERTQELEEANQQLQELDNLKSRFVSEVSHELRTPIANLALYVDLLKRSKNKPEKHDKYIEVLGKQAVRLENLVESVLYLSRLDLGQGTFELVPVDLNEVIEEVLTTQVLRAESKGLVVTYEATKYSVPTSSWMGISRPLKVLGDRNQLAQLVTNLVDNAISYTDEGFVSVRMFMDGSKEVCIEVADSGAGIPPREWDHVFRRFYRGELATQSNIPGNGLGLAITKEITAIHRGRIDLDSKVGEGSKFWVWLPIIKF